MKAELVPDENTNSVHCFLRVAKELVYDKCNFEMTNPKLNAESNAYGACSFSLNGNTIEHRVSKITPTKYTGNQFNKVPPFRPLGSWNIY